MLQTLAGFSFSSITATTTTFTCIYGGDVYLCMCVMNVAYNGGKGKVATKNRMI